MGPKELHIVSTGRQSMAELAATAAQIFPWVTFFHLREKNRTARELCEGIERLLAAGVDPKRIIINDRADVAAAMKVYGVHLAYHSLDVAQAKTAFPGLAAGKSVHSSDEAVRAEEEGADYLIFGHVFPTASKPGMAARGTDALRQVIANVKVPVIAIGGVTPLNAAEVLDTGAAGVAVMRGILEAADPVDAAQAYYQILHNGS